MVCSHALGAVDRWTESARVSLLRKTVGFTGLQLLSAMSSFAALPIIARTAGLDGWAAVITGQAIGSVVASIVLYGWQVQGPVEVSRLEGSLITELYGVSVAVRVVLIGASLPLALFLVAVLTVERHMFLGVSMAIAQAFVGFSSAWLAVGLGRPQFLFFSDVLPRLVVTSLAILLILRGAAILWYPILLIAVAPLGVLYMRLVLTREYGKGGRVTWSDVSAVLIRHRSSAFTQVAGSLYGGATVALVSIGGATGVTAAYGAGDKLFRVALISVVSLGNSLQSWVAPPVKWEISMRMKLSFFGFSALGILGLVGFSVLGPEASSLVFGPSLRLSSLTSVAFGFAFLGICLSTSMSRHMLIPLEGARRLGWITVSLAVIGGPALIVSARYGAETGAAWTFAVIETVGALLVGRALIKQLRSRN